MRIYFINPQHQVKLWVSRDGLPAKHQARLIKFKLKNPNAQVVLVYAKKYLTLEGEENIASFAERQCIELMDIDSIKPVDAFETKLLEIVQREMSYFFGQENKALKGNLSVVSDTLRMFSALLKKGIYSDMDVEFLNQLPSNDLQTLGLIARSKGDADDGNDGNSRISNDLIAGDSHHPVFLTVKKLMLEFHEGYHASLPQFFRDNGIQFNPQDYGSHPQYFLRRNQSLWDFIIGCGPDAFVRALNQNGISTGYEHTVGKIKQLSSTGDICPYLFQENVHPVEFMSLYPPELGPVHVSWDHSWQPDSESWKLLTTEEKELLLSQGLSSVITTALKLN